LRPPTEPVASAHGQGRKAAEPDFAFGHKITQAVDAVQKSIEERRWVRIDEV
jgi:hypothetical protein